MGGAGPDLILPPMSTLPPHETPTPVRPVLTMIVTVVLGTYAVLAGLAIAEHSHGRWALALLPVAALLFAVAGLEARRLLRRR